MIIYPSSQFKKSYKKLPRFIQNKAKIKDRLFRQNPFNPALDTHKLKGKLKNHWSYSVDRDYRVLFRFIAKNKALYFNIGTHDIYK